MPGMQWVLFVFSVVCIGVAAFVIWVSVLIARRLPLGRIAQRQQKAARRIIAGALAGIVLVSLVLLFHRGPTVAQFRTVEKGMTMEMVRERIGKSAEIYPEAEGRSSWVYYPSDYGRWWDYFIVDFDNKGLVDRTYSE